MAHEIEVFHRPAPLQIGTVVAVERRTIVARLQNRIVQDALAQAGRKPRGRAAKSLVRPLGRAGKSLPHSTRSRTQGAQTQPRTALAEAHPTGNLNVCGPCRGQPNWELKRTRPRRDPPNRKPKRARPPNRALARGALGPRRSNNRVCHSEKQRRARLPAAQSERRRPL